MDLHRNRIPFYENAQIALDLRLCSNIALQCQHQCKYIYRCRPDMLINTNVKPSILIEFSGPLGEIDGTKLEANWVKLGAFLRHDGAILGHLGEYLGDLAAIFAGLGGYLKAPWSLIIRSHTSLKCQHRSRLAPVQRKRPHGK